MDCPKCSAQFEVISYANIEVNRCTGCQGLLFGMLEHEHLKEVEGAQSIDIGDSQVGEQLNAMHRIDCPTCKSRMIPMVDREQPHIWYEACTSCYSVFFDAGEFKDFTERTILDFFKDLFAKERK